MASYPKPRYNTGIFIYDNKVSNGSQVSTSGQLDVTEMSRLSFLSNYTNYFASYPWLPAPNTKPTSIYTLWVETVYGEDYITQVAEPIDETTLTYEWQDSWSYIRTGVQDPQKIQGFGFSTIQTATNSVPRGLIAVDTVSLQRDYQPFVLSWSGTPTNNCITLEIGNFKLAMQSDYTVKYFIDNIEVAQSLPLLPTNSVNMFGFSGGLLVGPNRVINNTETKAHTRADVASPVEYTTVSGSSLPIVSNTGAATWTFKNGITLHGLNLYVSLTLDQLVYEAYLIYDTTMARTDPPTFPV